MQKAGVMNHMVVALDEYTKRQVEKWGSVAVFVHLSGQEEEQALQTGSSHSVSGTHITLSTFQSLSATCIELHTVKHAKQEKSVRTSGTKLWHFE
jgi:hypothetical protein